MFIAYILIGLFFITYAVGKDREGFRDRNSGNGTVIINAFICVFIWPIYALICIDKAIDADKKKEGR
jgi:hypothetical protein